MQLEVETSQRGYVRRFDLTDAFFDMLYELKAWKNRMISKDLLHDLRCLSDAAMTSDRLPSLLRTILENRSFWEKGEIAFSYRSLT